MGSFFDREVQRLESTTDRLTKRVNEKKDTESSKLETNKVGWVQSIKQAIYSHLYIGQYVLLMEKLICVKWLDTCMSWFMLLFELVQKSVYLILYCYRKNLIQKKELAGKIKLKR